MAALVDILREEVEAQIGQIEQETEAREHEAVARAERKAAARLEAHQKRMNADLKTAVHRSQSAAEQIVAVARVQARAEMLAQVQRKAHEELSRIRQRPDYGALLQALAQEASGSLAAAQVVVVHPDDEAELRTWAEQRGLELRSDPALHLGVRVADYDGHRSVENSLPERLRHAWDALSGELAAVLWP